MCLYGSKKLQIMYKIGLLMARIIAKGRKLL